MFLLTQGEVSVALSASVDLSRSISEFLVPLPTHPSWSTVHTHTHSNNVGSTYNTYMYMYKHVHNYMYVHRHSIDIYVAIIDSEAGSIQRYLLLQPA